MGIRNSRGFTVVEVMLFLAITGVVMATLLVGVGSSLNREKYRSSYNSLINYLQGQYNLVVNVNNSRDLTAACEGGSIQLDVGSTLDRGMSDCTIVGRLLRSKADGKGIESMQVYATVDARTLVSNPTNTDIQLLQNARLIADTRIDDYSAEWGTVFVQPGGNLTPSTFAILIVRMPTNGLVHTYVTSNPSKSPDDIVRITPTPISEFKLCVDPVGLTGLASQPVGALISKDAANSSGISFVNQGDC